MLKVDHIAYRQGSREILKDISFTALPGEFIAILGANGAGKSTLIKLISKQINPGSGSITLDRLPLQDYSLKTLSKQRAVLTQQLNLSFNFSVEEVVMMGRYPHFEREAAKQDWDVIEKVLRITDLMDYRTRDYRTLSGGEQQRVQLARVLAQVDEGPVTRNKLLLLDEPLNNLDIRHQHITLQQSADFAKQGNVVIAVLHDVNMAALYADKILMLKKGRQIAFGASEDVINPGVLENCYDIPAHVRRHPNGSCPSVYFGHITQYTSGTEDPLMDLIISSNTQVN